MPRFAYDCALRWSDLDAFGHVNNARFLTLYEEARVALMFTAAREAGVTSFEEGVVVARHEIDYLRPVDYGPYLPGSLRAPHVRIETWVDELRLASFQLAYELVADGVVASRARTVLVPYNLATRQPRRISAAEQAYLRSWLEPEPLRVAT